MVTKKSEQYISTIGRRKTASARIRLTPDKTTNIIVNNKPLDEYFPIQEVRNDILKPIQDLGEKIKGFKITALVRGGGVTSQAGAIRHGIARALTKYDTEFRAQLKDAGFLKRDDRSKERRKFGLKKARKAPQWSKR